MKFGSVLAFKLNGVEWSISCLDRFIPGDMTLVPIGEEGGWTTKLLWTREEKRREEKRREEKRREEKRREEKRREEKRRGLSHFHE
jgi:hypothetical protein